MKWSWDTGSVDLNWLKGGERTHVLHETLDYPAYRADALIRDKYKTHRAREGGKAATEDAAFERAAKFTGVAVGAATKAAVSSTASSMAAVGVDVVLPDGLHISASAGAAGATESTASADADARAEIAEAEWAANTGLDAPLDTDSDSDSDSDGGSDGGNDNDSDDSDDDFEVTSKSKQRQKPKQKPKQPKQPKQRQKKEEGFGVLLFKIMVLLSLSSLLVSLLLL